MSFKKYKSLLIPLFVFFVSLILQKISDNYLVAANGSPDWTTKILEYSALILVWVSAAAFANSALKTIFWEGIFAKAAGGNIPRFFYDFTTVLVYVIAVAVILSKIGGQGAEAYFTTILVLMLVFGTILKYGKKNISAAGLIQSEKPFAIGDYVEFKSDFAKIIYAGEVIDANRRITRLLSSDNTVISIPNHLLSVLVVNNYSMPDESHRISLKFCLDFSVPVEKAKRVLFAGAKEAFYLDGFDSSKLPQVLIEETSQLGVIYIVQFYIKSIRFISIEKAKDFVNHCILKHLTNAGLTLAYPKEDLYYSQMPARQIDAFNIDERGNLLNRIEFFHPFEKGELHILAKSIKLNCYPEGEVIIKQDDPGESMFILMEGLLDVQIKNEYKVSLKVAMLSPGEFFGEMSLFTGEPRSATVIADTDVIAYEITKENVLHFIHKRPEIVEELSKIIVERRSENLKKMEEYSHKKQNLTQLIIEKIKNFFKVK